MGQESLYIFKMKKYRVLKISPDRIYTTWNGMSRSQLEFTLCLIAQGYGREVWGSILSSYSHQAKGVMTVLLDLVYTEEEVEGEY